jgi:hypothetical protein
MTKGLFALLVAGTLTVPHIASALGNDATVGLGGQGANRAQAESWAALSLPPVPHLETMPWLTSGSLLRGPKIDTLLGPRIDTLGPFLVAPSIPPRHFSAINPSPQE